MKKDGQMLVWITAFETFKSGNCGGEVVNFHAGETKQMDAHMIAYLEHESPRNWKVTWPKP